MKDHSLQKFRDALLAWFATHQRSLPWRQSRDAYAIWVSEVMLQQTQVIKVTAYFTNFMRLFPDVSALARADIQQVLKAWEGLGYYARARNLHRAAQQVAQEFDGSVPSTCAEIRKLPGVGEYIAAAVASQAFQESCAVVDGNVKRVLARLFQIDAPLNSSAAQKVFRSHADELLEPRSPGDFNQAMMELGAIMCTPQAPRCSDCPVSNFCLSFQTGSVQRYPVTARPKQIPNYTIVVAIIFRGDEMLIVQRHQEGLLGGLWEFPGGKVETMKEVESARSACSRIIREKTGVDIRIEKYLTTVKHAYSHFKIEMVAHLARYIRGTVLLTDHASHRWITVDQLDAFAFHKAVHKIFPALKKMRQSD
ncbi:MAG: A/G-specific adenine glycosylase [Candidatus Zhuqueibacterota bacterium]